MSQTTKRICRIAVTLRPDKKIIKEELEKKNHDLNRVGYAALCSSAPYILEDACNYAKNTLVL